MGWIIDSMHSHVGFSVRHLMVSTVRGQFKGYRGRTKLDPADFTRSSFEGEVDVASIDTANPQRDEHLRASDMFDAARFPKISFRSTRIVPRGDGAFAVHGEVTIRGVTRPLTLDVEFRGTSRNHRGIAVAGVSATGTLDRKDFGLSYNFLLETGGVAISDQVKIEIDAELHEAEPAPAPAHT